jgi:hypothetical protein
MWPHMTCKRMTVSDTGKRRTPTRRQSSRPYRTVSTILAGLISTLSVAGLVADVAWSQIPPNCAVSPGGFDIDGEFYSDAPLNVDWARGLAQTGAYVFNDDGTPNLFPSLRAFDGNWGNRSTQQELSKFSGTSNKNNDDISATGAPWTWEVGDGGPAKNDLTDVLVYGEIFAGDVWIYLGSCTRSNNGDSHVDIQFNQAGLEMIEDPPGSEEGFIVGNGPHGGRTARQGDLPGDLIISTDFLQGGREPSVSVREWQESPPGSGLFEYVLITDQLGPNDVFLCTNMGDIPAPLWGGVQRDGAIGDILESNQFVEIAMNISAFGFLPEVLCGAPTTIMWKTRSSQEFTAELKDLELLPFNPVLTPVAEVNDDVVCEGNPGELCATIVEESTPPYTYFWEPGGEITPCINPTVPGTYCVTVTDANGCESEPACGVLTVVPNPVCEIDGPDAVCALQTGVGYCSVYTADQYAWSIDGNGTLVGPTNEQCVTVDALGMGAFTLTLVMTNDPGGANCETTCTKTVTVVPNPVCNITGPDAVCALETGVEYCSEFTADQYAWSIDGNGTLVGPTNEQCVTVDALGAGEFTLTLVLTNDPGGADCETTCTKTVTVVDNPVCNITGPDAVCEEEIDVQYCSEFTADQYAWSIDGNGTIVGPTNEQCVNVNAGIAGAFTLTLVLTNDPGGANCEIGRARVPRR